MAQGLAKQAVDEGLDLPLDEGIALEQRLFRQVFSTDDADRREFVPGARPGKARFTGR